MKSFEKKQFFGIAETLENTRKNELLKRNKKMKKILFICHGNICRSTMAEFLFKHMVKNAGCTYADNLLIKDWRNDRICLVEMQEAAENSDADFYIDSAATSREEIGEPVDRRTVAKLKEHGVGCGTHYARQVTKDDYEFFDLLILMDAENLRGIKRIIPEDKENKIHLMMEFAGDKDSKTTDNNDQKLWNYNSRGIKTDMNPEGKQPFSFNESAYTCPKHPRDVSDPWYTHNFEQTYRDLVQVCSGLINILIEDR